MDFSKNKRGVNFMDKKIIKKSFPFIVSLCLLLGVITLSMLKVKINATNNFSPCKSTYNIENGEMKAIWVPYMSLENKNGNYTEKEFKELFDNILKESKKHGINTMIVHVRPFADALYKSEIFPWSHIVSGTQGNDPGFDPLDYMIKATHNENIAFHAWINPLRVQHNNIPSILSETNLYNQWRKDIDTTNDNWVFDLDNNKYFNPCYPEVRKVIIDGIKEIVERYSVDGIHFDDYFYPIDDHSYPTHNKDIDKSYYQEYVSKVSGNSDPLSQEEWRIANINSLISGVYSEIKSIRPSVQFGISPQANVKNDIKMSADVYSWGSKKGYVDYLCPQLYVNFENPILPYDKAVNQWREIVKNPDIKYYIGLGLYKAGSNADNGTWKVSNNIIKNQIEYGRNLNCDGFMIYSWDFLNNNQTTEEVSHAMKVLNNQ